MPQKFLRKYGVATTLPFALWETDGIDFKEDAAHVAGDTKIMKDEGAEVNTSNGFTDEGTSYAIVLDATEMQAKRNYVFIKDQGTKAWLDDYIVIETYGHASAMHPFDLAADLSGYNVDWKFKSIDITNSAGDGLTCKSTGGNGKGINIVGHGTAPGINIDGGATGNGIDISTTDGHGINIDVGGSKYGINAIAMDASGGGIKIMTLGVGVDVTAVGYAMALGGGIYVTGGTDKSAVKLTGNGTGHGLEVVAGATGNGVNISSTVGIGIKVNSTNDHAIELTGGGRGININTTGTGIAITTTGAGIDIISSDNGILINASSKGIGITSGTGHGIDIQATGNGNGININAGSAGVGIKITSTGDGLVINSSSGKGINIASIQQGIYISGPSDGIKIDCGGTAIYAKGGGSNNGLYVEGGTTGDGAEFKGGASSGRGVRIYSPTLGDGLDIGANDGIGLKITATGSGNQGVYIFSANGHGIEINPSTAGDGIYIHTGGGAGINIISSGGHAISAVVTGGTTHSGLNVKGFGPGAGFNVEGGTTGSGIDIQGGVGGGHGIISQANGGNGHGFTMIGDGTGKDMDADEIDLIPLVPEAIMTAIVDADLDVRGALALAASSVNQKYALNTPSPGQMTIYKRNNVTVLTVVDVTESGRTRIV